MEAELTHKGQRQKSPNAPAYSLQECLEDTRRIFRIENQVPLSRESIAEHLSLASQSGPFNRKLSSLRQYGLLEALGKDLRVSDLFLHIDHAADDNERRRSLREALGRPAIFQSLLSQYENSGGGLPSDLNLTNQLLLKHRFTKNNAETVAKAFLESARFAGLTQPRSYHAPTPPLPFPTAPTESAKSHDLHLEQPRAPQLQDDQPAQCRQEIPLSPGRRAVVTVPENITPDEIAKIVRVLHALASSQ
jgi:hypothetical protein